jgi:ribonuclease Z
MSGIEKHHGQGLTRREALKLSTLALGGLALGGTLSGCAPDKAKAQEAEPADCTTDCACPDAVSCGWQDETAAQTYTYFQNLPDFTPFSTATKTTLPRLGENEMRITFMGSSIPPDQRRAQQMMSVFVEVGWDEARQRPLDNFVFDCGSGVCTNYNAMNVGLGRMDKVFLAHLHGDHMSDLIHIYCFGPSTDRLSPLYVWGPGPSRVESPKGSGIYYDDGTRAFCQHLREACRWHSESFSFLSTGYTPDQPDNRSLMEKWGLPYEPSPVSDDDPKDGYALIPIELNWRKGYVDGQDNVAYHNRDTGVKISFYPVIHARQGSIGYKLEWRCPNGDILSMIYSSDTKPEVLSVEHARNGGQGVDVLIHEMIVPANVWAMKAQHLQEPPPDDDISVQKARTVQNSSHTPQGAFGYLLTQIDPKPRLTVACHFPAADDTIACAKRSLEEHLPIVQGRDPLPGEGAARLTWAFDLLVITVAKDRITEQKGKISNFETNATIQLVQGQLNDPKYHDDQGNSDPLAQINQITAIEPCDCETGACHYRADGY